MTRPEIITWATSALPFASENGLPKLLQRDDYYPFGLKFNSTVNGPENKFTYNGKEMENEQSN
jgi:hypothetical protein